MLIYNIKNRNGENNLILHFGLGLLGTSFYNYCENCQNLNDSSEFNFNWNYSDETEKELDFIVSRVKEFIDQNSIHNIYILWTAGEAGFYASKSEADLEFKLFSKAVKYLSDHLTLWSMPSHFILISSAGGLHEGQRNVESSKVFSLKRPYSLLKLAQENFIKQDTQFTCKTILRVSSVYTVENLSGRLGLVPILILNGLRNKVTKIVGSALTLRDYVLDDDISKFIYNAIYFNKQYADAQYLVDGKPHSILEIKEMIEILLQRKLYLKYSFVLENASSITFSQSLKSIDFESCPLNTGIKQLYSHVLNR